MAQQKSTVELWTDEETRALVKTRIKRDSLFTGSKGNVSRGWIQVIKELKTLNIKRENDKKIKRKWSDELIKWKNLMNPSAHNTGESTEDGDCGILDMDPPEVFEMLSKYHKPKHTFNPPALMDTSMPSTSGFHMTLGFSFGEHSYATSKSEYLGSASTIPPEYIESEVVVPASGNDGSVEADVEADMEDDVEVSVTASGSKRCSDFYKRSKKKQKNEKEKKNTTDDWLKEFLVQNREDRKQGMSQLEF